jgi:AcrR family transcriptional regulator
MAHAARIGVDDDVTRAGSNRGDVLERELLTGFEEDRCTHAAHGIANPPGSGNSVYPALGQSDYRPRAMPKPDPRTRDAIVDATIDIIVEDGYDAVALSEVARRARVSLATIYKLFPTQRAKQSRARDEVIVAAIERWIGLNVHSDVTPASPDETLHDALLRMLRYAFEPWLRSPGMLVAYHRVANGPHRLRVRSRMYDALAPVGIRALEAYDARYAGDVSVIMELVSDGAIGWYAEGHLELDEVFPTIARAVYRLTSDNTAIATLDRSSGDRVVG